MVSASREIAMPSSHASGASDGRSKKVFVLGGDGFCGWPTALHLADKGHEVVIISATNNFVVSAIAQRFGITEANVLSTPLEIVDERYTGKLTDKPNFQEGKIYHLNKWLDKKQQDGIHFTKTYAYSDSKNDIPLLEWADIAVCVSPDKALHAHALANRWAVEDWSI